MRARMGMMEARERERRYGRCDYLANRAAGLGSLDGGY